MAFISALPITSTSSTGSIYRQSCSLCPHRILYSVPNFRPSIQTAQFPSTLNNRAPTTCSASTVTESTTRGKNSLTYTSLDNNGFVLRFGGSTIVIDPWLYGDLIFSSPSVFKMSKQTPSAPENDVSKFPPSSATAIVLTQGLEDHTHVPTLSKFPRDVPIFAPPSSEPALSSLQFTNVTYLKSDDSVNVSSTVKLTTLPGALVGPPWSERQLGLLFEFSDVDDSTKRICGLYHEPHGDHVMDSVDKYKDKMDIVVTPYVQAALEIPIIKLKFFTLVYGSERALEFCRTVSPKVCIAFNNSRGEDYSGFLVSMIGSDTGKQKFKDRFAADAQLKNTKLVTDFEPMEELMIWEGTENNDENRTQMTGTSIGKVIDSIPA